MRRNMPKDLPHTLQWVLLQPLAAVPAAAALAVVACASTSVFTSSVICASAAVTLRTRSDRLRRNW